LKDDGAFTVDDLIGCYRTGVFPMADSRHDPRIFLVDPHLRGIIEPNAFHLSRRLARTVRAEAFEVRIDHDFAAVVAACAAPTPERQDTWINPEIERLYLELHGRGQAHSVECWQDGAFAGGLYGVCLGAAFFGESMVSRVRDASKVALVHLFARLRAGGFALLDCQFMTDHLRQFGTIEIEPADYRKRLSTALQRRADFFALPAVATGGQALQVISQTF